MAEFRDFRLRLRPVDLLSRGHVPGPAIGTALRQTAAARLNGEIGPEEELDYALEVLGAVPSGNGAES